MNTKLKEQNTDTLIKDTLSKLPDLVRSTLQNSNSPWITRNDEYKGGFKPGEVIMIAAKR